jgi:glycosyltransferase involved in cell wall biosynthesis
MDKPIRKILVYATGPLGERLAGPEIRALQFAKALSADFDVTLMAQREDVCERDGFHVVPSRRELMIREARRNDAVVSPCLPPYLVLLKRVLSFKAISDKYDPHEVELIALEGERHDRELQLRSLSLAIDLRCADVVLCAAERQRESLIAAAHKLERPGLALPIDPMVVPFAIPDAAPPSERRPLREAFPQIRPGDKIVFWWGAVWKWLDAETPIRALAGLADSRPDVKLVITAGAPPNANNSRFEAVDQARSLASELGVLDRTVLFLDEWIPYEERHDYLRDADVGLTLHRFSDEAELAARARYIDYLSAELPCILGRGDETAAELEDAGFATLVDHRDPDLLAELILTLVDDPDQLRVAGDAGRRLAAERRLSTVTEKLRAAVTSPSPAPQGQSARRILALAGGTGSFYAHKLVDRVVTAAQ